MNKYLEQYVENCKVFDKDGFLIVLDRELNAVFVGNNYLKTGGRTRESIIGRHIYQTAPIPPENIEPSFRTFNKAITENKVIPVLIANLLHRTDDSIQIFGAQISPISEPESKTVVGLRFEFYKLNVEMFFQALIKDVDKIPDNGRPHNDDFLSKREHQIAFLLFHCKNYTEITQVINIFSQTNITEKTVRNTVSGSLFDKFKVHSKERLLEKLAENGYARKMPNSLLTNRFIDLSR